jgi:DNA end-binding protein Ku
MARATWTGSINFGLVNVPVKLYPATSPKSVKFNQLNGKTGARIQQKRIDPTTGKEVAYEDIVKGFEVTPDRFVTITGEELEGIAPKKTRMISVEQFVMQDEIDPLMYDSSYYLGPADALPGTGQAYKLLTETLARSGKVAIGRIVLRTKEQLCALRVIDGVLTATTMLWPDEIHNATRVVDVDEIPGEVQDAMLGMAGTLIDQLTVPWDPGAFHDEYRQQVMSMIQRKADGELIEAINTQEPDKPAPDLMAALAASLKTAGEGSAPVSAEKPAPTKKPRAKRTPVAS